MRKALLLLLLLGLGAGAWLYWERSQRVTLTLVPGRSVWQHAKTIAQKGLGTEADILSLVSDRAFVESLGLPVKERAPRGDGVASTWLEGFIYPETYAFSHRASPHEVLARSAQQFQSVWGALRAQHALDFERLSARYKLKEADFIVLASLVEKEMALRSEAPTIAGVFYNRLDQKMRLETDPTLMYRPDRVGKAPSPNERRDRSNPYNTYAISGLPPGPICSPGRDALLAVLRPEEHDYLFFVAKRDGTRAHAFSRTLDEHRQNIDRYLRKKAPSP